MWSSVGGCELEISGSGFPSSSSKIHGFEARPVVIQTLLVKKDNFIQRRLKAESQLARETSQSHRRSKESRNIMDGYDFVQMSTDISFSELMVPLYRRV